MTMKFTKTACYKLILLNIGFTAPSLNCDLIDENNQSLVATQYQFSSVNMEIKKYEQTAIQGDKEAQYKLGLLYHHGRGIAQSYYRARYWYALSATQGYKNAQCNLGVFYYHGHNVIQNYHTAHYWFEQAAVQGSKNAQYNMGLLYHHGYGVTQNYNTAQYWYKQAAAQGDREAQINSSIIINMNH